MAETRSGELTTAPHRPIAGVDVHEPSAPAVDPVADDPRQPAQWAFLVQQALGRELGDRARRRPRPLTLVGLLDPYEVTEPEQLLPKALDRQRHDLLAQHAVAEPRTAVAVRLADLLVDDLGLRHDADRAASAQTQAVLEIVAPDEEVGLGRFGRAQARAADEHADERGIVHLRRLPRHVRLARQRPQPATEVAALDARLDTAVGVEHGRGEHRRAGV